MVWLVWFGVVWCMMGCIHIENTKKFECQLIFKVSKKLYSYSFNENTIK